VTPLVVRRSTLLWLFNTDMQILILKGIIEEEKKNFWGYVAARMGKTAKGCERSAKEEKIQVFAS